MEIVCYLEVGAVDSRGTPCEMHLIHTHTHTHTHTIVIIHISGADCVCSHVSAASTSGYQMISIQFQLILSIDNVFYTNINVSSLRMTHKGSKHVVLVL